MPSNPHLPPPSSTMNGSNDMEINAQQMNMLEQILERRLAHLELDYERTIAAENNDEIYASHGYSRFDAPYQLHHDVEDGNDETDDTENTNYNGANEEKEPTDSAVNDGVNELAATVAPDPSFTLHEPLTNSKIELIKTFMSDISVPPPYWARAAGMKPEVWQEKILERAGFVRQMVADAPALASSTSISTTSTSSSSSVSNGTTPTATVSSTNGSSKNQRKRKQKKKKANVQSSIALQNTEIVQSNKNGSAEPELIAATSPIQNPNAEHFHEDFEVSFPKSN